MLRNLGLDLDLSKVGKDVKLQLALPNKTIKKNITNVTQANLDGVEINGLPKLTFEIPHKIQKRVGTTEDIETIDNPDIKMIKEKMLIKVTWYNKKRVNWFRVTNITQTDSQDFVNMKVEADALQSELRATNVTTSTDPVNAIEYFTHVLSQTTWKLGYVSDKVKDAYRSFDDNKKTRYEAINNGLETFGAIAEWNEENRVLNVLSISDIREFRGVVLKKENYVSSLEIESNADDIVTRLYVYGNEKKGIEKVNPTGMAYIEDFSYFMFPFERDTNKNVLSHSDYMSDELCHAILDLKILQDEYNPRIKDLQGKLNKAYGDLSKANMELVELEGQLVTLEALLDTAKATNDLPLVAKREAEVQEKEIEIFNKKEESKNIQASIDLWEKTIFSYQELISTTSFTQELQNELSLFIYEQEFSDDRYIDEKELYEAGREQFDKYQRPVRTFNIQLASFVNSIESQHIGERLQIGEEVLVKSTKLKTEYKSIVLGYNVDFKTGDYQLIISDNMDDINSLDKLATLIYKADSSSTILNNNKYKWDNVTSIKSEVEAWRDKEIKAVENRIIAGANESVVIDNRGIQAHNPDFPDERIIMQSGVVALSRNGGKTWSTSITPYGVNAETIIGKIIAGENLIITNDNGTFVIDNTGLTINMDDIHIMSGQSGSQEDMVQLWNNLLLTYDEIASDNLVNEYEKNQLEKQWTKIVNINSSMLEQFIKGWKPLEEASVAKPIEYNEYIKAYEDLNKYLNVEKQKDGFVLLDKDNRKVTTEIDPIVFADKFKEYEMKKQAFESIISMKFTKASIDIMAEGISLNYTKNKKIVTQLNLSEEGIRIDGKLLEINSETHFNADLVMNAGLIRDKDGGILIDLNKGEITLNKPIHIGADSNLVSKDYLDKLELEAHTFVLTNDSAVVPTDKNGMNGDYTTAFSSAFIYKGTQDITDKWKISTTVTVGVSGELVGNTYTVKNMTKDTGTVTFIATMGTAKLTKTFNITKAKAGLDGSEGKVRMLSLSSDSYIMTFTNDLPKPEKQTIKVTADLIGIDKATTWKVVPVFGGKELLPIVKRPTNNVIEITEKDLTGNIDLIKVSASVDDLKDTISIVKVKNGDGIKSTRVEYQIGDSGTTQPNGVWSIVLPQPVKGKYLWTRTTTVYTDDTSIQTYSVSYYALDGQAGQAGDNGNGIEKTVIEYQVGTSGTVTPTGSWTTSIPTVDKGKYLWTRTTITYTDKTTSVSYSTSYSPKDGEKGQDSITGFLTNESISLSADVSGTVSDYKNANGIFEVYDGITRKTGVAVKYSVVAQDSVTVTIDANGKYVTSGFVTGKDKLTASATLRAVYGGVTLDKQLTLSKAFTGATGSSASSYWVTPTVNVLATTPTGRINPEAIGFNAYTKSGTSNATVYNGRFIIETSIDGKDYTVRYTSTKDEPNCVYTVDIKAKFVKVKMYQAGATTYLLDEQTIPVLDIDGDLYQAWANSPDGKLDFTRYLNTTKTVKNFAKDGSATPIQISLGKKIEYTDVTVIHKQGTNILKKDTINQQVDSTQTYNAETFTGYTLSGENKQTKTVTKGMVVTFEYTKDKIMTNVTVRHMTGTTELSKDTFSHEVGTSKTYSAKTITDYAVVGESSKTMTVTSNMIVTFNYEKVKYLTTVTVLHKEGTNILDRDTFNHEIGTTQTYGAKAITGYTVSGSNTQQMKVVADMTVTFNYTKNKVFTTVTTIGVEKPNNGSLYSEQNQYEVGTTQRFTARQIEGYTLTSSSPRYLVVTTNMVVSFNYEKKIDPNMLIDDGKKIINSKATSYESVPLWSFKFGELKRIDASVGDEIEFSFKVDRKITDGSYFIFQSSDGMQMSTWLHQNDIIEGKVFTIILKPERGWFNSTATGINLYISMGGNTYLEFSEPMMINKSRNARMLSDMTTRKMDLKLFSRDMETRAIVETQDVKLISTIGASGDNVVMLSKTTTMSIYVDGNSEVALGVDIDGKEHKSTFLKTGFLSVTFDTSGTFQSIKVFLINKTDGLYNEVKYSKLQWELGNTRTVWESPNIEVKTMAYVGYSVKDSDDYKDYKWSVTSQKVKTYKAWADAEDGSINFTRIAPNENLYVSDNYNKETQVAWTTWNVSLGTFIVEEGQTVGAQIYYTDVKTANVGVRVFWKNASGSLISESVDSNWITPAMSKGIAKNVLSVPKGATQAELVARRNYETGVNSTANTSKIKFEILKNGQNDVTLWTPSPENSLIDSIMKFTGISVIDSDNPVDYEWVYSAEFAQAISQIGINEAQKIAEDAKNTSDNAVQNEEFYSWLEQDYENQMNNLAQMSEQNTIDLASMEGRTTAIEKTLGKNKIKWNFIDESMTFSEEGMFISNSKSKMRIQISSDKIVFWDNNVDVATISSEQLTIKRGLFLDSATIGNHVITKYSDASPVTIIRYVGKV